MRRWGCRKAMLKGVRLYKITHMIHASAVAIADATAHQRVVKSNVPKKKTHTNRKKEREKQQQKHKNTWILQASMFNVNKRQIFGVYFFFFFVVWEFRMRVWVFHFKLFSLGLQTYFAIWRESHTDPSVEFQCVWEKRKRVLNERRKKNIHVSLKKCVCYFQFNITGIEYFLSFVSFDSLFGMRGFLCVVVAVVLPLSISNSHKYLRCACVCVYFSFFFSSLLQVFNDLSISSFILFYFIVIR